MDKSLLKKIKHPQLRELVSKSKKFEHLDEADRKRKIEAMANIDEKKTADLVVFFKKENQKEAEKYAKIYHHIVEELSQINVKFKRYKLNEDERVSKEDEEKMQKELLNELNNE